MSEWGRPERESDCACRLGRSRRAKFHAHWRTGRASAPRTDRAGAERGDVVDARSRPLAGSNAVQAARRRRQIAATTSAFRGLRRRRAGPSGTDAIAAPSDSRLERARRRSSRAAPPRGAAQRVGLDERHATASKSRVPPPMRSESA